MSYTVRMMDWKRPLSRGPRIPTAPVRFCGTLREYVDIHLASALPRVDVAVAWHKAIAAHAAKSDSILLVRATPGFKQEDETLTGNGRPLRMTDNAPPWWIHAAAFSGMHPPVDGLAPILDDIWCWMIRADGGGKAGPGQANKAGWYIAHILQAKPSGDGAPEGWSETIARQRFLRNFSPLNQFLVPKGNGREVGEGANVIATIADWYLSRYGDVFEEFLDEAGLRVGEIGQPMWDLVVEMVGQGGTCVDSGRPRMPLQPIRIGASAPIASDAAMKNLWPRVLEHGQALNRRATILGAVANASARLAILQEELTVEGLIGVANALFNQCDPSDLEAAAPGDFGRQGRLAWTYLDNAKASPNLGGKWAKCVTVLRPGSPSGLSALATLGVEDFVSAALRIVSQVYRKL